MNERITHSGTNLISELSLKQLGKSWPTIEGSRVLSETGLAPSPVPTPGYSGPRLSTSCSTSPDVELRSLPSPHHCPLKHRSGRSSVVSSVSYPELRPCRRPGPSIPPWAPGHLSPLLRSDSRSSAGIFRMSRSLELESRF